MYKSTRHDASGKKPHVECKLKTPPLVVLLMREWVCCDIATSHPNRHHVSPEVRREAIITLATLVPMGWDATYFSPNTYWSLLYGYSQQRSQVRYAGVSPVYGTQHCNHTLADQLNWFPVIQPNGNRSCRLMTR
ncbi:hypothetical protein J6590_020611 [Homalodisca vitripennis]|nr:hypothetical protein J6590_020611 [Homalodisca vitripennis]